MLTLTSLTAGYGPVTALDDVSLTAREGEITAVLGANGAGKTTLLRTVSGLHRPRSGTIDFDGTRLESVAAEKMPRLGLAHVPEGRGVITELTVEENLRLGGLGRGGRVSASDLERVYDLFPILGDRSAALASTLSGGERQMLVIGRALMARPTMLLLDEPSLGLAPRIVAQIFGLVRDPRARGGAQRAARRAERPQRPLRRRPRRRAQPRTRRRRRPRRRAGRGRPAPPRLPRILNPRPGASLCSSSSTPPSPA